MDALKAVDRKKISKVLEHGQTIILKEDACKKLKSVLDRLHKALKKASDLRDKYKITDLDAAASQTKADEAWVVWVSGLLIHALKNASGTKVDLRTDCLTAMKVFGKHGVNRHGLLPALRVRAEQAIAYS